MQVSDKLAIEGGTPVVPADIHRTWPDVRQEDKDAIMGVLDSGELWGAHGPQVTALQEEWAEFVGTNYCLAVNSGTAALHCCTAAVGLEPGDEVIVPAFSFIATPMAVLHAGCAPVFCDIDLDTYNLDVEKLEDLITQRTKAIVPVHIHGLAADMDGINAVAERHGLAVFEDAAQAHGSTYKGKNVGTLASCAAFSLNGAKNLSAGEGGLFVTDDEKAFIAARRLAIFGEDTPKPGPGEFRAYWSHGVGWNYRTNEIIAALARSQLTRLNDYNSTSERNADILTEGLSRIPGILPPRVPVGSTSVYHRYRFRFDAEELGFDGPPSELRDRLLFALRAEGVAASTWQLLPLSASPVFRRDRFEPWHPGMKDSDLKPWDRDAVANTIRVLEGSLVLGPEAKPLYVQEPQVMELYLEAFDKILRRREVLFSASYEPVRVQPAIPEAAL